MNELKPEDVMRALECCIEVDCGSIAICPRRENYKNEYICSANLKKDALALLREKDALLEKWDADFKTYEAMLNSKDAEIERLQGMVSTYEEERKYHFAMSRKRIDEAIAEFAEKLKSNNEKRDGLSFKVVSFDTIDQIAEKLKGEPDEL